MALRDYTLVEVFGEQKEHRCGYCKSGDTNGEAQSYGMWAHFLSVQDYENLLNRGWRRSGKYLYKPTNQLTCCPAYTINCHALDFKASKSQKKVLKKFNNYLLHDETDSSHGHVIDMKTTSDKSVKLDQPEMSTENISSTIPKGFQEPQAIYQHDVKLTVDSDAQKMQTENVHCHDHSPSKSQPKVPKSSHSPVSHSVEETTTMQINRDESHGKVRKAKELRLERKKQKLIQKGIDPSTIMKKQSVGSEPKNVEDFIIENSNIKRKFVIKTVRVNTKEFETTFELEYQLYRNYQVKIHQDKESDCTQKQFKRFLCDSPLVNRSSEVNSIHGSYHQQYYMDDELIAVGVIDILPSCLSSVYFFYNPDYMFLSLGNFGALREIAYVRELNSQHSDIRYYYMGFYIHSCVKMRYKGNYSPSYLLCPEMYTWHLLDDKIRAQLAASKYCRLNESSAKIEKVSFRNVTVLHEGHRVPYYVYRELNDGHTDEDVQKYANLVGAVCANSIVAYLGSLRASDDY